VWGAPSGDVESFTTRTRARARVGNFPTLIWRYALIAHLPVALVLIPCPGLPTDHSPVLHPGTLSRPPAGAERLQVWPSP